MRKNKQKSFSWLQEIEKAHQMIKQEQPNLNPDLGELIPVPLYPTKQELIPKPNQDKEKYCKNYRRKVLLTTGSGESLICMKNVTFVIDVGVERRKVSKVNQNQYAKNQLCWRVFPGWGRGKCAANRLMPTVSKGTNISLFFSCFYSIDSNSQNLCDFLGQLTWKRSKKTQLLPKFSQKRKLSSF